jgi:hypothetical protein
MHAARTTGGTGEGDSASPLLDVTAPPNSDRVDPLRCGARETALAGQRESFGFQT